MEGQIDRWIYRWVYRQIHRWIEEFETKFASDKGSAPKYCIDSLLSQPRQIDKKIDRQRDRLTLIYPGIKPLVYEYCYFISHKKL